MIVNKIPLLIISYQNVVGNYNGQTTYNDTDLIISYQNVVGNYNIIFISPTS